jgi:hypothetical protein
VSPVPTAPGAYVNIAAAAASPQRAPSTGTWFVTGESSQGPTGIAIPITSMVDFANFLGGRTGYTTLYDSLDEFFHDGGVLAYASRVVGPSAAAGTLVLVDRAGSPLSTLTVNAALGVWGNSTTVAVTAGSVSNTYVLTIANTLTGQTWVSPNLYNPADAVVWANNLTSNGLYPWLFPYTIVNDASGTAAPNNNPAVLAATNLASGADDNTDITETQWTAALTAFISTLGPGQVSAPGHTTQTGWEALIAHAGLLDAAGCLINNRVALLDTVDSSSASTVIADAIEAQAVGDPSYGMYLAPWVLIPGVANSTVGTSPAAATRTIPPSALMAALIAANDQVNNAGQMVAGNFGLSQYAIGVTQTYGETNRGLLNTAGVIVIRQLNGIVQPYGFVSLSLQSQWVPANFVRLRMAIVALLNTVAQGFVFSQIDGQGHLLSHFNGALAGVCQNLWQQGALYGAQATDAFNVNTGPAVNTPANLANGILSALVSVRMSPGASFVIISVVQYPVTSSLAA